MRLACGGLCSPNNPTLCIEVRVDFGGEAPPTPPLHLPTLPTLCMEVRVDLFGYGLW